MQRKINQDERTVQDQVHLAGMSHAPTISPSSILDLFQSSCPQMFDCGHNPDAFLPIQSIRSSTPELVPVDYKPLILAYMQPISQDSLEKQQCLQEQFNAMLKEAEHRDEFGEEEDNDDSITEEL